jgi:hypothetical protein
MPGVLQVPVTKHPTISGVVKIPLTDTTRARQTDPYANAQSHRHHARDASDAPTGHVTGGICALGISGTSTIKPHRKRMRLLSF